MCASIEKGFSFSARSICRRKQDAQRLAGSADALDTRAESSRGKQRARTSAHECKAVPWVGVGGRCRSCGEGGRRVRDGPASNPPTAPPLDLSTINDHVGETKPLFGFGAILHASNRFAIINNIFLSRQNQYHVHHFARWGWRWGLAAGRWRCDLTVTATRVSSVQCPKRKKLFVDRSHVLRVHDYEVRARCAVAVPGARWPRCALRPRPPTQTPGPHDPARQPSAECRDTGRRETHTSHARVQPSASQPGASTYITVPKCQDARKSQVRSVRKGSGNQMRARTRLGHAHTVYSL